MDPDPRVLHRFYDAYRMRDVDGIAALLTEDVLWHVPGTHSRSGTYSGKQEVVGLFSRSSSSTFEVEDLLTGERYAMALVRFRQERGDRRLESKFVHAVRTVDGRLAESWHFDEDQAQLDEFRRSAESPGIAEGSANG